MLVLNDWTWLNLKIGKTATIPVLHGHWWTCQKISHNISYFSISSISIPETDGHPPKAHYWGVTAMVPQPAAAWDRCRAHLPGAWPTSAPPGSPPRDAGCTRSPRGISAAETGESYLVVNYPRIVFVGHKPGDFNGISGGNGHKKRLGWTNPLTLTIRGMNHQVLFKAWGSFGEFG